MDSENDLSTPVQRSVDGRLAAIVILGVAAGGFYFLWTSPGPEAESTDRTRTVPAASSSVADSPAVDSSESTSATADSTATANVDEPTTPERQLATFGSGCFWCSEAIFEQLKGVSKVESGYSGGKKEDASYYEVSSSKTGHAEVVQIEFDPTVITYAELLEIFWSTHDPTTLNRQGADVGPQYRSVVFYHSAEQKLEAEKYKKELNDAKVFENPIVTEISEYEAMYPAEDNHQDFFSLNPNQGYCHYVIRPKLEKLKKVFSKKLKKSESQP